MSDTGFSDYYMIMKLLDFELGTAFLLASWL